MDCEYQYSSTVGTMFHNSHLPLHTWFLAIQMIHSAGRNVSARKLKKELQISYESAFSMSQRIRIALRENRTFCLKLISIFNEASPNRNADRERNAER
jgi:transposase-like protein